MNARHGIDISQPHYEGISHASFGELLQGVSTDNDDFLVTFPIDLYSKAYFYPDATADTLTIYPGYKSKVQKFVISLLKEYNATAYGTLIVESDIPEGKGLSSSTADMVAVFRAIQKYLNIECDLELIGKLFRAIEPSDGLLYAGSVIYKHKKCSFVKSLGKFPPTHIIAIDEGGVLDTISYNKVVKDYNVEERTLYSLLLKELSTAFSEENYRRIGFIAMQSALMNQKYNNKNIH